MNDRDDQTSVLLNVLAGIGIGAIMGAVAGLLLAPKAGRETREELGARMSDLGHRVSDMSDRVATRVRSAVEAGRRAVEDTGDGERLS
jgi:gas vesicle protein